MRLPAKLLKEVGGEKRRGLTVISFIAMVLASFCGVGWGLTRSAVETTKPVFCKMAEPKTELQIEYTGLDAPRIRHSCGACGRG